MSPYETDLSFIIDPTQQYKSEISSDNLSLMDKVAKMDEDTILGMFSNLAKSLKFIHSANIIHRNLKPENILITQDLEVVIAGFG